MLECVRECARTAYCEKQYAIVLNKLAKVMDRAKAENAKILDTFIKCIVEIWQQVYH